MLISNAMQLQKAGRPTLNVTTLWVKKQDTKLLPITSPNVNRISQFFHCQTQR